MSMRLLVFACHPPVGDASFERRFAVEYDLPGTARPDPRETTHWVFPVTPGFEPREYQLAIVKRALFENSMVSLPTGLGKTFIAAVVMANYFR